MANRFPLIFRGPIGVDECPSAQPWKLHFCRLGTMRESFKSRLFKVKTRCIVARLLLPQRQWSGCSRVTLTVRSPTSARTARQIISEREGETGHKQRSKSLVHRPLNDAAVQSIFLEGVRLLDDGASRNTPPTTTIIMVQTERLPDTSDITIDLRIRLP